MNLNEISLSDLSLNPFDKIGKSWFLISSGDQNGYNTMTASWGFMGIMWGKNTFNCVVRPSRHTFDFIEKNSLFTISFFDEKYRDMLNYCGSHSGRDVDKAKETGLTPLYIENTVTFEQASEIYVCKKIYSQNMSEECIIDKSCLAFYETDKMHKLYIGEIIKAYSK